MRNSASLVLLLASLSSALGCRARESAPKPFKDPPAKSAQSVPSQSKAGPVRIVYPAAPGSFVELTKQLAASVVHLRSSGTVSGGSASLIPGTTGSRALGTAFVLNRQGHLVTNEHIISTAPEIWAVLADGEQIRAKVIGRDSKLDLALLQIQIKPERLKPVQLGDSDLVQVGEWVVALGNPVGTEVTASAGIISALGKSNHDSIASSRTNYQSALRTDAKIDVSNSGGPLIDTTGAVIGISTAVANQSQDTRLAIPINRAKHIFPMLASDGVVTRSWLGVFVHPVSAEVAKAHMLGQKRGALVSEVMPSSPAAQAGLRAGDIILRFRGKPVDHHSLAWLASSAPLGQALSIVVWRQGQETTLTTVSAKMPE